MHTCTLGNCPVYPHLHPSPLNHGISNTCSHSANQHISHHQLQLVTASFHQTVLCHARLPSTLPLDFPVPSQPDSPRLHLLSLSMSVVCLCDVCFFFSSLFSLYCVCVTEWSFRTDFFDFHPLLPALFAPPTLNFCLLDQVSHD